MVEVRRGRKRARSEYRRRPYLRITVTYSQEGNSSICEGRELGIIASRTISAEVATAPEAASETNSILSKRKSDSFGRNAVEPHPPGHQP